MPAGRAYSHPRVARDERDRVVPAGLLQGDAIGAQAEAPPGVMVAAGTRGSTHAGILDTDRGPPGRDRPGRTGHGSSRRRDLDRWPCRPTSWTTPRRPCRSSAGSPHTGVAAAGGMRVSNPSVTWPNHTTLMSGVHPERHGVLFNGVARRAGAGDPGESDLRRGPVGSRAGAAALRRRRSEPGSQPRRSTGPARGTSASIDDNFPDVPDQLRYTTPRLKEELAGKGLLVGSPGGGGVVRDEIWAEAACQAIRRRKPRLLALHLLNLDSTHHRHGPKTPPVTPPRRWPTRWSAGSWTPWGRRASGIGPPCSSSPITGSPPSPNPCGPTPSCAERGC